MQIRRLIPVLYVESCIDGGQTCCDIGGRSAARNPSSSVHTAQRRPNKRGIF